MSTTTKRNRKRNSKHPRINIKRNQRRILQRQKTTGTDRDHHSSITISRIAPIELKTRQFHIIAQAIVNEYEHKKCISIARQMISLLNAKDVNLNQDLFTEDSKMIDLLGYLIDLIEKTFCSNKGDFLVAHLWDNAHFVLSIERECQCRFGHWSIDLIDIKEIKNRKLRLITEKFFSFLLNKSNVPSFESGHWLDTYGELMTESIQDADDKEHAKWLRKERKKYEGGVATKALDRIERINSDDLLSLIDAYRPEKRIERLMMAYIKEVVTRKVNVENYDSDQETDSAIMYSENNQILYDSSDYFSELIIESMNERWGNSGTIEPIVYHHLIRGKIVDADVKFSDPDFIYIEKYFKCFNLMIYHDKNTKQS